MEWFVFLAVLLVITRGKGINRKETGYIKVIHGMDDASYSP